jgi:hypothetical protein
MSTTFKRPYVTHYYAGVNDGAAAYKSYGAAASEQGAIRAAIVRVFLGQWAKAVVHDRATGVALYNIRVGVGGIRVQYGSGVPFKSFDTAHAA